MEPLINDRKANKQLITQQKPAKSEGTYLARTTGDDGVGSLLFKPLFAPNQASF